LLNGSFTEPMSAPAVTGIGIGAILEAITAQHVEHGVLDALDGRGKIRDEMVGVRVEQNSHRFGKEGGELFIGRPGLDESFVGSAHAVLLKAANGASGAQNGVADPRRVKSDQSSIPFLDLNDSVLDRHQLF
jgi:hypothetical protein